MRKYLASVSLALTFFCLHFSAKAQDVLRTQLDNIFQNINKSQIPFGYLEEY